MLVRELLQFRRDSVRDGHVRKAFCAVDSKGDDRLPIEASEAAHFRGAISDRGNVLQLGLSTARQHDRAVGQILDRRGAREHPYGLLLRSHVAASAWEIDI